MVVKQASYFSIACISLFLALGLPRRPFAYFSWVFEGLLAPFWDPFVASHCFLHVLGWPVFWVTWFWLAFPCFPKPFVGSILLAHCVLDIHFAISGHMDIYPTPLTG